MPKEIMVVRLVCMYCKEKQTIHVPRDRRLPDKILWECLECQKKRCPGTGKVKSSPSRKSDT